ncbi:NAD(P)H-dependent oxidoreductase [Oceaniserpentilla sp. 4NH20-0058]|uniref:flavodoxin family protein n=1 Tax=Oceaniserpentilla sp. 4NH20-0058 TaxID=3127660 RepID=UPI003105FC08
MKTLLIVFHTPSDNTQAMADAMLKAVEGQALENLNVVLKTPFETQAQDVLACDGIVLGTTENLGYMSGALKDFFDRIYYPCLEEKQGLPVVAVVRAGHDGTGTCRALNTILTGLKWRWVQDIVLCRGPWQAEFIGQCEEVAAAMAVGLSEGMI